jgi:hypothetical protein
MQNGGPRYLPTELRTAGPTDLKDQKKERRKAAP